MAQSRVIRIVCWVFLVLSPLISILIMGFVCDTSVFSLDAWNTEWNDERGYYRAIVQMREMGAPTGMAGYNEVPAANPSYGPYPILTYVPYYLGSFITGYDSHNFMYIMNMALGVLSCVLIVLILRPNAVQALLCAALFLSHFIVTRYLCSGMSEASYVFFAALFASCALYVVQHADDRKPGWRVVLAFAAMILSIGFWGVMRPYIAAFAIVVWLLLWRGSFGLRRMQRVVLFIASVLVAGLSVAGYFYLSKYYVTPYFAGGSIGSSFFELISSSLADLPGKHAECLVELRYSLKEFGWLGIMVFTFALCWVLLLALCVKAKLSGESVAASLFLALVIIGVLVFEAHIVLYDYNQMHRTLILVDIIYLLVIFWHAGSLLRLGIPVIPVAVVVVVGALCIGSMRSTPEAFALPQVSADYDQHAEEELQKRLKELMPFSDDPWDNTIVHSYKSGGMYFYFNLPSYVNNNTLQPHYLEQTVASDSFKSKYLGISEKDALNDRISEIGEPIYQGYGQIVYRLR